ncbi:MAG TPA: shikimate kinase [Candidatus Latescibacteria bacterium]|nr:shikimate kinase [Candidatus Latescibacterota bacterium]
MSLPLSWIDRIFDKLMLVYGRDFTGRWEGLPLSSVKTDWAHELSGFDKHPEAIKHALNTHGGIIALGGGAATREENWQLLRSSGAMTIYLQASPRTILARVADKGTRPLLAGLDRQQMLEKITSLLEQREPWYLRADITLPTDNSLDKYGMADSLVARLKEAGISAAESHRTS